MNTNQLPPQAPRALPVDPFAAPGTAPGTSYGQPAGMLPRMPGGPAGPVGPGGPNFFAAPVAPRPPRFSREQIVATLLAGAGVGVTLVGVVLLLVMAARQGLLVPEARVGGGVLLAITLGVAALYVRPKPGGRVGSVALLGTAAAAAFFDVIAVTRIYHWLPMTAGLALALVVGALSAAQAMRWDEKWLFVTLGLAVAGLAPFLTQGANGTLVAFLVVLQIAGILPEVAKGWAEASAVRTVPVVLALLGWFGLDHSMREVTFAVGTVAAIGLLSGILTGLLRRTDAIAALMMALSWVPLWVYPTLTTRRTGVIVCVVAALVALAGLWMARRGSTYLVAALSLMAGVSGFVAVVLGAHGGWRAMPFFAVTIALFAVHGRITNPVLGWVALGVLGTGLIAQDAVTPFYDLFYGSRVARMGIEHLVLVAVAATAVLAMRGRHHQIGYLQTVLVVTGGTGILGVVILMLTAFGRLSQTVFFTTQLAVTVLVLVLAASVLMAGLSRPRLLTASMRWGLVLVGCALLKLVAFDLAYLGAMTKAFTCVIAGLVLLSAGTAYARRYAQVAPRTSGSANA